MAKWQKNLAVFAVGCMLTGAVTIGIGVIAGGIQDVKEVYMAPEPPPKEVKKEYTDIKNLDLDFTETGVRVERADVDKVTVILTTYSNRVDYTGTIEEHIEDGTLHLKNKPDLSKLETPEIDTDILGIFSYFRKDNRVWYEPVVIQLPKDMVLKNASIQLHQNTWLKIADAEIQTVNLQTKHTTSVTLSDTTVHQLEGELRGSLFLSKSDIKGGKISSKNFLSIEDSKLENLSIEAIGNVAKLTQTSLKDSQIKADVASLNLDAMTYLGKIVIENKGNILVGQLSNLELLNLDLTAESGNIRIDVNDLPHTEIMDEKKSTYQHKGSQVRSELTIKAKQGNIELKDWREDDESRPE